MKLLRKLGTAIKSPFAFGEGAGGRRRRKEMFVLAGTFCALIIIAILVGVGDNMPGIVLCYLAAITLVIALTRTWKKPRKFLILMGSSVIAFFSFVVLHNLFYALAIITSDTAALSYSMAVLEVVFFIIAIFLCPAAFLVGAVGSVVFAIRGKKGQKTG